MRSRVRVIAGVALVVGSVIATTAGIAFASHKDHTVLRGDVMVGVDPPFTGSTNPIRGINGGGAPWVIGDVEFRLRASGRLDVEFEGLVIGPNGPPAIAGTNPVAQMKVTVSCLSKDAAGAAVTTNVSTDPFPVSTPEGNGEVEAMISLPSPCIAPIIFIANGNAAGAWFAATGA